MSRIGLMCSNKYRDQSHDEYQQEYECTHAGSHTGTSALLVCSTRLEKGHFLPTRHVTCGPRVRVYELRAAIESISGFAMLLPFTDILADELLEVNVLSPPT